jgi:uncharacterized protein (TIGR03067 family)
MSIRAVVTVLSLFITVSLSAQEQDNQRAKEINKQELEKLQGEWTLDAPSDRKMLFTVKGSEYTFELGGRKEKIAFTIDATKDPKVIDRIGTLSGIKRRGIYKLNDDTLTICSTIRDRDRPTEFKAKEDELTLVVWKRVAKQDK